MPINLDAPFECPKKAGKVQRIPKISQRRNFDKKQMIPEAQILVLMGSLADDRGEILPP